MKRAALPACWLALLALQLLLIDAAKQQKPIAAYAPLFTGVIKLSDVPAYASPGAPAVISPIGRKRRLHNFPPAAELSTGVLERVHADLTSDAGRRKLQQQQQGLSEASPSSFSNWRSSHDKAANVLRDSSRTRRLQQLQAAVDAGPTAPPQHSGGWSGLWWAEAGGIGLAAGPNHIIHAISTVLAVYTVDPVTGSKQASKIFSLQDLFAPVGSANCKEGVYDAIPLFDKHAQRYLITAVCSGKGAVLLAATATSDPTGSWFLFNLMADAADTGMACTNPVETALAESVRVTYNTDGVYLSLFNYCPSRPEVSGASILALPKQKVYKGAPNFVYGVWSADQIWEAVQPDPQDSVDNPQGPSGAVNADAAGLRPANFRQCQPAPPVTADDAQGGAAYFVCDHIGPDANQPRSSFTLVSLVNTGALWQFAGTAATSPTPFLTATLVDRGMHLPVSFDVKLQQPQGGSQLHAGGTTPSGFWSGAAVLSAGKVYTVDRVDLTNMTVQPPMTPVTMPSLQWTEVDVKVLLTGAGDCSSTTAWGSKWDWGKDWSQDWGKDFDLEWEENVQEAAALQQHINSIQAAMKAQMLKNCSASAAAGTTAAAAADRAEISDGSLGTIDTGSSSSSIVRGFYNCTAAVVAAVNINGTGSSTATNTPAAEKTRQQPKKPLHHRKLTSGSNTPQQQQQQQQKQKQGLFADSVAAATAVAAEAAASSSRYVLHWRGTPLPDSYMPLTAAGGNPSSSSSSSSSRLSDAASNRRLSQFGVSVFVGWDLGCWYCTGAGGVYYSSSWFYRYWYAQWDFGWYRRYKRNYAPGWSHPVKWVGRRHMLQVADDPTAAAAAVLGINSSQLLQNDSIIIPPCLRTGLSYKNTCKQCNYTNLTVKITVNVTRSGLISQLGPNPLGFVAPAMTVISGGEIVIMSGYSGPGTLPDTNTLAYPGVASLTIPPDSTAATFKALRPGLGKVRSRTGRWSDFSSIDVTLLPPGAAAAAAGDSGDAAAAAAGTVKVHYGVQWSQRLVTCRAVVDGAKANGASLSAGAAEGSVSGVESSRKRVCAMPSPWLGQMIV